MPFQLPCFGFAWRASELCDSESNLGGRAGAVAGLGAMTYRPFRRASYSDIVCIRP